MRFPCSILIGVFLLVSQPKHATAIVTSDTAGSHVVAPGGSAFGLDTSGVARLASNATGALITDFHILTAAHIFDLDGDGIVNGTFLPDTATFELAGGTQQIAFAPQKVRLMPDWLSKHGDLALIELDAPAPAAIPRYPLYGLPDELGRLSVVVGYGVTGHGLSGASQFSPQKRAGLNRFEALGEDIDSELFPPGVVLVSDFDSGLQENNSLFATFGVASDLGFADDEVAHALGDSGGPIFIDGAISAVASLGLGGIPGDVTDAADSSWGEVLIDTRVSAFREFIVEATGGQAVFVPEPSTWVLAACALVAIVLYCVRHHRGLAMRVSRDLVSSL
jgi:hypothetical protein